MNDLFESITKTVNKTTKKAMKVSGNMIELTKTSLNIKFDEAKKENFYKEIGKTVYEKYTQDPQTADDEILGFCQCIDEINDTISAQKLSLAKIQKQKFCPACGQKLERAIVFCFTCGEKQPEIPLEEEVEDDCCCCDDACECNDNSCECDDTAENTDNCCDDSCGCDSADTPCDCASAEDNSECNDDNCGCGQ